MRVFRSSCVDMLTNLEMVATELSYNEACDYLSNNMRGDEFIGIRNKRKSFTEIIYNSRSFFYDEERAILLGE